MIQTAFFAQEWEGIWTTGPILVNGQPAVLKTIQSITTRSTLGVFPHVCKSLSDVQWMIIVYYEYDMSKLAF